MGESVEMPECEEDYLTIIDGIRVCRVTGSKCCLKCRGRHKCKALQCPALGFNKKEASDCFKAALYIRAGKYIVEKGDYRYHRRIKLDLRTRDRRCKAHGM